MPVLVRRPLAAALCLATFAGCAPAPTDDSASASPLGEAAQASIVAPICTTVQRGVSGTVRDAVLNSSQPDKAYGTTGSLTAGLSSGVVRESVIGFDLAFIPAGSTITSATLSLFQFAPTGAAQPVRVHRATAAWNEATVTWNSFGGARAAQVEAQIAPVAAYSAATADVSGLVQQWANGTPNHGMVLERDLDGSTVYATSEGIQAQHPSLSVCYVPPFCNNEADGTACDDGNPNTYNDVCTAGVCAGVNLCAGVVCTPLDQCHLAGTCNPATGLCSASPAKADGTACDDGSAGTSGDRCVAGVCAPTATCADGVQNQGEAGVDCGGPCGACADGSSSGVAGTSCATIHAARPTLASGTYWLDPDGAGGVAPFQATCDMTLDGGGWTLIGRGPSWWSSENLAVVSGSMLPQAQRQAMQAVSSSLYRAGSGATYRLFIRDAGALFQTGYYYWRSNASSLQCSTSYAAVQNGTMATTSARSVSCDPVGVGQHSCGYGNGWILLHANDTYNYSNTHPCSFGTGGSPTGAALSDIWIR